MSNARDTNYFTTKIYKLLMWWMIINKWKNDINGGSKWKPIRMSKARDTNYFTNFFTND